MSETLSRPMFPGFRHEQIDIGEVTINAVVGGEGPPLLLLHGYPQTHVVCPVLALWGAHGVVGRLFKPLDEWRNVATQVGGKALPCGHYIPEEVPDLLVDELLNFFEGGL